MSLVLVWSSNSAFAQGTVPPLANLDGHGVLSSRTTTADLSADVGLAVHQVAPLKNCPDAPQIRDTVLAQRINASPGRLRLSVQFYRQSAMLIASIEARGVRAGSRELRLETDDCQALLQPLAVSLTLLLDPEAEGAAVPSLLAAPGPQADGAPNHPEALAEQNQGQAVASATQKGSILSVVDVKQVPTGQRVSNAPETFPRRLNQTQKTAPESTESKPKPARASSLGSFAFGFDLGPLLIAGLVPRTTYGLEVQGFARYGFFSVRVAASGCASETLTQGNGRVRAQTTYGRLGWCGQWPTRGPFSIALCQGSWLGRFVVQGSGFPTDRTASPWFVAVGGFFDANWTMYEGLGVYLRGGGFAPLTRHRFNVDGVGSAAFHSQAFGAWVGLGGAWTFQ